MVEIIGFVASAFVLLSLLFKTNTRKGALILRSLNSLGSAIFIIYGFLLPAYSTAFLNIFALMINVYYILRMDKDYANTSNK